MKIDVLLIIKETQDRELLNDIWQWKKLVYDYNEKYELVINSVNQQEVPNLLMEGKLERYFFIFTPFLKSEELFDLMDRQLKNTTFMRLKEGTTFYESQYEQGNQYPTFTMEHLSKFVQKTIQLIEKMLENREQTTAQPQFLVNTNDDDDIQMNHFDEEVRTNILEEKELDNFDLPAEESQEALYQSFAERGIETLLKEKDYEKQRSEIEESFLYERTRTIRKQLFAKQSRTDHKNIGIWSPISRIGVTTFTFNYALFLAENRVYVGVLEGLRQESVMKYLLKRYTKIPNEWVSFPKTIHQNVEPNQAYWSYRDVLFLPLDDDDNSLQWNSETLELYMITHNLLDVTLVDLPNGEMATYTLDSLIYLDELWILVDDTIQEILAWKKYIHLLQSKFDLNIKLIFNQAYEFSQIKRLSKDLEFDVITSLPAMHEDVKRNYYSTKPLLIDTNVRTNIYDGFCEITRHLLGSDFQFSITKDGTSIMPTDKQTIWAKFRRWLNG